MGPTSPEDAVDWTNSSINLREEIERHKKQGTLREYMDREIQINKERCMSIPKELRGKIGTKKAQQEHNRRRAMQKKDEEEVFGAAKAEQERLAAGGTNFALFNFILSTVDFRDCEPGSLEAIRKMYAHLMVHMNRVCREAESMAKKLDVEFIHPTDMATKGLQEITKRARKRAKVNAYKKGKSNVKIYS